MSKHFARTLWNVPYQRNPFFTGREDMLSRLDQALHAEQRVMLSQPQGISGLGGIGKTQTAVEYAYRHRGEYDAVLWVRADSIATLTSSMVELAQLLELPECKEQEQDIIVQAVLRWVRANHDWLLIYDNIDDLSLAERFFPKAATGHLLFTTRAHALGRLAQRLDIPHMEPEIGALLLLRRASFLALQDPLNRANPDEQYLAQTISQELDGLPLALDQAGAYIKETPCSLPAYLARYQSRRGDLLRMRGSSDQDYPASVATTWSLSFEKIGQAHPAAPELLNFCAFLAPDAIPEDLLTAGSAYLGEILAPVVTHPLQFDQVCKEVLRFSLLQRGVDEDTFAVHRLVQAVLRDSMPNGTQEQWMRRVVPAVDAALPAIEFANWPTYERLVPHALTCATWVKQVSLTTPQASRLLDQVGYYLKERVRYVEAEPLLERALAIRTQLLGTEHQDTATSLNSLAELYREQGRYVEAEPLLERALAIRTQLLGTEHQDTATSLNNLAELYREQGRYAEAEPLLENALAIRTRTEHPETTVSLNNLAELYREQGRYMEAEQLYQRALMICEQQLGAEHPNTAVSLNNLALFYKTRARHSEAESLYQRALLINTKVYGENHTEVATNLNNLGLLYKTQAKYSEAEPLYQHALAICEHLLGAIHPTTGTCLNNLAELYREQGRYVEAEPLYQRALAICEQELGAMHPSTARSLSNLAALYREQKKYAEAEPLSQRALAICEQELGAMHFATATTLNNLAELYREQGKYVEAEPLYQRALAILEQELGAMHPSTATGLNNLAKLYRAQGRFKEAEPLSQRALTIREQQLGTSHPNIATSLNNLAELYRAQGKLREAEPLLQRTLSIYEQALGTEHPTTQTARADYAVLLEEMKRTR